MRIRVALMVTTVAMLVSGCLGTLGLRAKGSRTMVQSSSIQKPAWIERGTYYQAGWIDKGALQPEPSYFFVGRVDDAEELALGEQEAEYTAKRAIASAVYETISGYYRQTRSGPNRASSLKPSDRDVETLLSGNINKVALNSVLPVERYWERWELENEDRVATSYSVYVLVRVPEEAFNKMKSQAATDLGEVAPGFPARKR